MWSGLMSCMVAVEILTSPFNKVLRKLLASKNPEDLRAANRLIREMVRRVSLKVT